MNSTLTRFSQQTHFVRRTPYLSKIWISCQLLNIRIFPASLENSGNLALLSPHSWLMTSRVTTAHCRQVLALDSHRPHLPRPSACAGGSRDRQSQHTQGFSNFVSSRLFPCWIKTFSVLVIVKVNVLFLGSLKWGTWHKRNVAKLKHRGKQRGLWEQCGTGQLRKLRPKEERKHAQIPLLTSRRKESCSGWSLAGWDDIVFYTQRWVLFHSFCLHVSEKWQRRPSDLGINERTDFRSHTVISSTWF